MTLPQIKEKVERMLTGGIKSSESRWDAQFLYNEIHNARAVILRNDYIKNKRWSPQAIQPYYPEYDIDFQDSLCYTRFELPTGFIQADARHDGLVYFGSSSNKIMTTRAFSRIKSRVELSDFLRNKITSPASGLYVGVLIEGDLATIVSKDIIKYPYVSGVWDNPTLLLDYSLERDHYPMSSDMINIMATYIYESFLGRESQEPIDTLATTSESTTSMLHRGIIKSGKK